MVGPERAAAGPRRRSDGLRATANAARLAVVFDSDPLGAPAIDDLEALRGRMPRSLARPGSPPRRSLGGQTAVADETVEGVLDDLKRIGRRRACW